VSTGKEITVELLKGVTRAPKLFLQNRKALTLAVYPSLSSRNCISLSLIDVVPIVGFFMSAEVAERISEAV